MHLSRNLMKGLLLIAFVITVGCPVALAQANAFSQAGISFEVPETWEIMPSERYAPMKESLNRQLSPYNRHAEFFTMILAPNQEAAFLVSKINCANSLTIKDIRTERERVYEDAIKYGDVETINDISEFSVAGHPALLEDVTRKAQGRGVTVKVLIDRTIVEISFVVPNRTLFSKYRLEFDKVLETLSIAFIGKDI